MHGVLLDRDGTLSLTGGYCHPADFQLAPWAGEAIRLLNQHGLPVAIVTSQTGIAHGKFTTDALHECFLRMIDELAQNQAYLSAIYYCPHITPAQVKAYAVDCPYHKPKPGMLLRAAQDLQAKSKTVLWSAMRGTVICAPVRQQVVGLCLYEPVGVHRP